MLGLSKKVLLSLTLLTLLSSLPLVVSSKYLSLHAQDEEEGDEWRTMESERRYRRRAYAPSIKFDLENKKIVTGKISFVSNGDQPTAGSLGILKQLAKELNKKPEFSVRIEGHADSVGSDQANQEISQRRADRIKEVLVQDGVAAERLQAIGMGDKHPIASDTTPGGQEKNRRVELHLLEAAAPTPTPTPSTLPPVSAPISPPLPPISSGAPTQPAFPATPLPAPSPIIPPSAPTSPTTPIPPPTPITPTPPAAPTMP